MQLTIVSGRSGSGKSITLRALEDLGYTCVDNCPITLLPVLLKERAHTKTPTAISLDARNIPLDPTAVDQVIKILDSYKPFQILYLDAKDETLIKRFGETRRKHPLSSPDVTLLEAIQLESHLLTPLAEAANYVFDTTDCSVAQINSRIQDCCTSGVHTGLQLQFVSFGYKHGKPSDADLVFDARCLPNPYWVPELKEYTGLDPQVKAYLQDKAPVKQIIEDIISFIDKWIPQFEVENRCYLTVAVGCTGGQHRSVYVVEQLFSRCQSKYPQVQLRHRHMQT